ncbi:MAG: PecA family PE domain-processing aspartic protease [Mycobacterium sp.]
MSHAARKHHRLRPYAWLGAGAVTLGMGAAMVGGAAIASADPGAEADSTSAASTSAPANSTATSTRRAPRSTRSGATATSASAAAARPERAARAAVLSPGPTPVPTQVIPDIAATAPTATAGSAPTAAAAVAPRSRGAHRAAATTAPADPGAVTPTPAATPAAAVEPTDPPFIPNNIVPGQHVTLALAEIAAGQASLNQATWGAGDLAAGIAAIVPQLFMAEASLSLTLWQNNMPGAQQLVAATVGVPIIHQLTEINLFMTATLPTFAQFGLGGAALFLPLVSLFGAATAPTEEFISQARSNGLVYAVVPVQMKYVTEPIVGASIAGGPAVPLLVDTGSSGLVTTLDRLGTDYVATDQTGTITYSGASSTPFNYRVYQTTVDFGSGAVADTAYVDVIEDTPAQEAAFKEFVASTGSVGILGTGAAAVGPGPGYIPTAQLPGELSDGYLLNQSLFGFGLFGVMIFGPNPFPARVSVPGSPYGQLQVQIGSNPPQSVTDAIIDSGGVYGTLPASLFTDPVIYSTVPAGTKISVYTEDGQTLLYSYITTAASGPTIVPDDPLGMDVNTGNIPFGQQLIYTDYSSATYPNGATVFSYA